MDTWNAQTVQSRQPLIKVVICGKYINLNKITKFFCYSLQITMQNRGICCLKRCFNTERSKGIFVRENLKK